MIKYVVGDATKPIYDAPNHFKIIMHVCNSGNIWGGGFVLAVSKEWPEAEEAYHDWFLKGATNTADGPVYPELGNVQFVQVTPSILVANMIAQVSFWEEECWGKGPPIRYEALRKCMAKVAEEHPESVHCPRLGCSISGGSWAVVEKIIEEELCAKGIEVVVYDFPGGMGYNP